MEKGAMVVIALGAIGLLGVFVMFAVAGSPSPSFNCHGGNQNAETQKTTVAIDNPVKQGGFQAVDISASGYGYNSNSFSVKKGIPVRLSFSATPDAGCGRELIMDEFGVNLISRNGETKTAEFTPTQSGTYSFHCPMNMFRGELKVE